MLYIAGDGAGGAGGAGGVGGAGGAGGASSRMYACTTTDQNYV